MIYKVKRFIRDNEKLMVFLATIYRAFGGNRIRGHCGVKLQWRGVFAKRMKIICQGKDNIGEFGEGCRMSDCTIRIFGNGNRVKIDHDCVCKNLDVWISDGANLRVGHNTHFAGDIHLACIEGKTISIGKRCLFSNGITFRTGDSHVITDLEDNRINFGKDIVVGDHVWVGHQAVLLKGANIGSDSIVGTRSLVTKGNYPEHVVLGGSPAKVIRTDVSWRPE